MRCLNGVNMKMGKHRFFCDTCNRFHSRRAVYFDPWDGRFYCKDCDNPVIKTAKVLKDVVVEFLKDAPILGKDIDKYR